METITTKCPFCGSDKVTKNGHNATGKQIYHCKNAECKRHTFVEGYTYNAYNPDVREQVLKMAADCTGIMAIGCILNISKNTVTAILQKRNVPN